jgi:hydrogenase nickel incorporation protein HypA/HybF
MHEFSFVRDLLGQVKLAMRSHAGRQLRAIRIEIGPLAGLEPLLVSEAFEQLRDAWDLSEASLVIEQTGLMAECQACGHPFEVLDFEFVCPCCRSQRIHITQGDQLQLVDLTIAADHDPLSLAEELLDEHHP